MRRKAEKLILLQERYPNKKIKINFKKLRAFGIDKFGNKKLLNVSGIL